MKKSSLLSLLTAAAIVTTSAGTFAAWDNLTATSTGTLSVPNDSVEVTKVDMGTIAVKTNALEGSEVVFAGEASFTVTDAGDKIGSLNVVPEVKDGDTVINDAGKVEVTATPQAAYAKGSNKYDVVLKVKDSTLAGKTLTVSLTATAVAK